MINRDAKSPEEVGAAVTRYLQNPVTGDGDWPEVTRDDMDQLHKIIQMILEAKFENDVDGDRVIEYALCNRKKHHLWYWVLPHRVENDEDMRSYTRAIGAASSWIENLSRRMEFPIQEKIELERRMKKMAPVILFLKGTPAQQRVVDFLIGNNSSGLYVGKDDGIWARLGLSCAELRTVVHDSIGKARQREIIEDYLLTAAKAMGATDGDS